MDTYDDKKFLLHSGNFRFERLNLTVRCDNSDEWHYFDELRRDDWLINVERVEPESMGINRSVYSPLAVFLVTRFGQTNLTILFGQNEPVDDFCGTMSKIGHFAFENDHAIRYACLRDTPFDLCSTELIREWRLNEY